MKCSELLRLLLKHGWEIKSQSGSHVKLRHDIIKGSIIFPNHGSKEVAKGTERKLLKQAGIK